MDPEELERLFGSRDSIAVDMTDGAFPAKEFELDALGELVEAQEPEQVAGDDHYANLALEMDATELDAIAQDLCAKVEADDEARSKWKERLARGLERMGLVESDIDDGPFPGAASVVHPVIAEACTQFWARSFSEIFPPGGPAKAAVIGHNSTDKVEASKRLEDWHNFEIVHNDRGYYRESSRLLWRLPMLGSQFRKTFADPLLGRTRGMLVEPENLIIIPTAESLDTASRYTHKYPKTPNELRKLMAMGHYRRIELTMGKRGDDDDVIKEARDDTIGVDTDSTIEDDAEPRTILEVYCELDLPGHEDVGKDGEPTGIELPYVVVIDDASGQVLAIFRNWSPDDEHRQRENYFSTYEFVPGHGPYGYGLFHLIGGLQDAATGSLRALLDSAATASIPGGFVAKDANIRAENLVYEPGVFKPVEATAEEFSKAFLQPPTREPAPALFQLLGFLVDTAQKFTATTEMQVGEANRNMPVGTTLALMEAGAKVQSTIHQGLHLSVAHELRIRHEIARARVPEDGYPYDVGGDPRAVMASDFDHGVSIVPVSDPNIFSNAQRIGMAQMAWQLANEAPDMIDRREALRRMFEAVRMPDIDELMAQQATPMAYDPPGEIQAIFMGKPVLVDPNQPHALYLQHHAAFLQNQQFGGNDQVMQAVQKQLLSVIGQHLAYAWQQGVAAAGMPSAPLDPQTGQPMQGAQQLPPQMMAQMMQQIVPQLAQIPGLPGAQGQGPQADPIKQAERQLELQHAEQKHQQQLRHEEEEHRLKLRHELAETTQTLAQKGEVAKIDVSAKAATGRMDIQKRAADARADAIKRRTDVETKRADAETQNLIRERDIVHDAAKRDYESVQRAVEAYRKRQSDEDDHMLELRRRGEMLEQDIREKGIQAAMTTARQGAEMARDRAQGALNG